MSTDDSLPFDEGGLLEIQNTVNDPLNDPDVLDSRPRLRRTSNVINYYASSNSAKSRMLTTKGEDTGVYIENLDIDSLIRRTITPTHDSVADPDFAEALQNSRVGREFPIIARFLPKSERFFEHLMLLLQKQEEVSGWVGGMLRKSKQDEAYKSHLKTVRENRILSATINDERTKRIIMDARTASVFSETGEPPPTDWHRKLRTPFDWFYLEFSEPILIGEQENIPEHHDTEGLRIGEDAVRAMLVRRITGNVREQLLDNSVLDHNIRTTSLYGITVFLTDDVGHHTRRGFVYDIANGTALTRVQSVLSHQSVYNAEGMGTADVSVQEGSQWRFDISELPDEAKALPDKFLRAGHPLGMDDRYLGFWERIILSYGSLFSWLLVYMMAKGIEITEERLPRAVRRREQKKDIPKPWHIVQVEPRFATSGSDPMVEGANRFTHNIRYDVIGHLRCVRKKREDGTYENTFTWVRPHQRGLANDIYVPKTANFKAGKQTHPVMNDYFPNKN